MDTPNVEDNGAYIYSGHWCWKLCQASQPVEGGRSSWMVLVLVEFNGLSQSSQCISPTCSQRAIITNMLHELNHWSRYERRDFLRPGIRDIEGPYMTLWQPFGERPIPNPKNHPRWT